MDRRSVLKLATALGAYGLPASTVLSGGLAWGRPVGEPAPFNFAWLKGHARHLASQPYESRKGQLPTTLRKLSWDDYKRIAFRPKHALWRHRDAAFQAQFFHLGLYYQTPVELHEVVDGQARRLAYDPDYFAYRGEQPLGDLPEDLGYAGFRIHFHTDFERDVASFLGASYFRAVGKDLQYGMSARGLAIDTASEAGEEFPVFTAFWLEQPASGDTGLTVYALLESESITGAYAFELYPGRTLVMDVTATLYPRREIQRLGIAPLTSMYQVGENHHRRDYDWRPEIHDSDGLSIHTGEGEWIWRPLVNPASLHVNTFADQDPKGFGLLQRDRQFDHYQDDGVFYDERPSVWVEPREGWGEGGVMLVEIPTDDETVDNIVSFWKPDAPLSTTQEHRFNYRLHWGARAPEQPHELATVRATRTGLGGVVGQQRDYFSWRFVVDFSGGMLDMLGDDARVEPIISVSRGRVEITSARPLADINGYRAMFDLVPDASTDPIDIRLFLKLGEQALTETWIYQYTPPPEEERRLY